MQDGPTRNQAARPAGPPTAEQLPPRGRLRPTVRAALFVVAFLLANIVAGGLALLILAALGSWPAAPDPTLFSSGQTLLLTALSAAATVVTVLLFRRFLDRASFASLGLHLSGPWAGQLLAGWLLGAALFTVVFLVEVAAGGYIVVGVGWSAALVALAVALLTFLFVAISEELAVRGYILQNLEADWGWQVALLASALVFGVAHLANPSASLVSSLAVAGAGLLLGAAYLATRALWLPIGLHWAWNFFEGPIYGFPVSGAQGQGMVNLRPVGPVWLTGGAFGPEASAVVVAVELLGTATLLAWAARRGRLAPRAAPGQP